MPGVERSLEDTLTRAGLDRLPVDGDATRAQSDPYSAAALSPAIRPVFSVKPMVLPGRMKG